MLGNVAAALVLGDGLSPVGRVGVGARNVRGRGAVLEEIDRDGLTGDLGGIDAAAVGVETRTIRLRIGGRYRTSHIRTLPGRVDVAVAGGHTPGEIPGGVDGTTWVCVKRHGISRLRVHAFDDV